MQTHPAERDKQSSQQMQTKVHTLVGRQEARTTATNSRSSMAARSVTLWSAHSRSRFVLAVCSAARMLPRQM
jgi:hypothetical protein